MPKKGRDGGRAKEVVCDGASMVMAIVCVGGGVGLSSSWIKFVF